MKLFVVSFFASLALAAPSLPPEILSLSEVAGAIPGRYIVKLKPGASTTDLQRILNLMTHEPEYVYDRGGLLGFAGELDEREVADLYYHVDVETVEADTRLSTTAYVEQPDAPWGLARISHRMSGTDTYIYDDSAGEGTCAYIIDTGIYTDHVEFEGRAEVVANFVKKEEEDDLAGHGTHCAGTVGGKTYGVAKKTRLLGVKVMDKSGGGNKSDILAGLDFILEESQNRTQECPKGIVVSISLGTPSSDVLNGAVKALTDVGLFVAVAAGNSATDAATFSPASEETACTVAAMEENDRHAKFSNFGSAIDIYAPGVNVLSAGIDGETSTKMANGTSMAAPHVAGLAAYLLALNGPMNPQELCQYMGATATPGRLANPGTNAPNLVAFNGNTRSGSAE